MLQHPHCNLWNYFPSHSILSKANNVWREFNVVNVEWIHCLFYIFFLFRVFDFLITKWFKTLDAIYKYLHLKKKRFCIEKCILIKLNNRELGLLEKAYIQQYTWWENCGMIMMIFLYMYFTYSNYKKISVFCCIYNYIDCICLNWTKCFPANFPKRLLCLFILGGASMTNVFWNYI